MIIALIVHSLRGRHMTNRSGSLRTSERRFHGDDECHGISVLVANVQSVSPDDARRVD